MNIVIFDDEELFLKSLEQKITSWAMKNGHTSSLIVHRFTSSEDMLEAWNSGMRTDALFLDIQTSGEMNGLAAAKVIHSADPMIPIVFITSYGEYAEEGYHVNALRYLRKPISERAVHECMDIIWRRWMLQQTDCVAFDMPNQVLRLPAKGILFIDVSGHHSIIHSIDNEYRIRQGINAIMDKLPAALFSQCHRSCVVNLMYVRHIKADSVIMADNTELPIGRNFKLQFISDFRKLYLEGNDAN